MERAKGALQLTKEDMELINSKNGLYALLRNKKVSIPRVLDEASKMLKLKEYQIELIKLQEWVAKNDKKVVIIFEGRDSAGKGGAIRRITEYINPREFRIVALDIPTDDERKQWFFQRYIEQLPRPGEIVFFDRSWYNRAVVEPVNGFCTPEEYEVFMDQVNAFERMLTQSNTILIKFYFSITKEEQSRRFNDLKENPLKRWKLTPVDERAQELWDEYTKYKEQMFEHTNTEHAPWKIIAADNKFDARLDAISYILSMIPYKND